MHMRVAGAVHRRGRGSGWGTRTPYAHIRTGIVYTPYCGSMGSMRVVPRRANNESRNSLLDKSVLGFSLNNTSMRPASHVTRAAHNNKGAYVT